MKKAGLAIYGIFTAVALLLAAFAALEFGGAEMAKGNALMRAGVLLIGAVLVWSFGRAVLRALTGK